MIDKQEIWLLYEQTQEVLDGLWKDALKAKTIIPNTENLDGDMKQ